MEMEDMIKALKKNPNLKFSSNSYQKEVSAKTNPFCIGYVSESGFHLLECCERDLAADWQPVLESVDFMTAINSGKTIRSEFWGQDDFLFTPAYENAPMRLTAREIRGKWYIVK